MTDHIVVGDRVLVDAGFRAARDRLAMLADGRMLWQAAEVAYGEGITHLVRAAGRTAGLTRLAGAGLDGMAGGCDRAHVTLRWTAIAADGKLFTALYADLMLAPAGDRVTALSLAGAYWLPPAPAGAWPDPAAGRQCAAAAVRRFLIRVACELAHPAGMAEPGGPRRRR